LSGAGVPIRVDEPTPARVVIPALEVVEACLAVVHISAVPQRVGGAEGIGLGAGDREHIAPRVVGIGHHLLFVPGHDAGDIALGIAEIVVAHTVIRHRNGAQRIIDKVQFIAAPQHVGQLSAGIVIILIDRAAHLLGAAQAVGVVGVGDIGAGLRHTRQLAAMLPSVDPRAVIRQVANGVVGQRLAAIVGEQILPCRVAVGVGLGGGGGAEGAGSVGVLLLGRNVAAVAVGIRPRLPCCLIILALQLVEGIVGVPGGVGAIGDRGNVAPVIVSVGVGFAHRVGPSGHLRGRGGVGAAVADGGGEDGGALVLHRGLIHAAQPVVVEAVGAAALNDRRGTVVRIVGVGGGVIVGVGGEGPDALDRLGQKPLGVVGVLGDVGVGAAALLHPADAVQKVVVVAGGAAGGAVLHLAKVAVVVVGVFYLVAVLVGLGLRTPQIVIGVGDEVAVAVGGFGEVAVGIAAVGVGDEAAAADLDILHQIEVAVGEVVDGAAGGGDGVKKVVGVGVANGGAVLRHRGGAVEVIVGVGALGIRRFAGGADPFQRAGVIVVAVGGENRNESGGFLPPPGAGIPLPGCNSFKIFRSTFR